MFQSFRRWLFGRPSAADEIASLREQVTKRALEAQLTFYDNLVDPREPLYDDPDFLGPAYGPAALPLNYDNRKRGEAVPVYLTEQQLKLIRDRSRRLLSENEFAINAVENRVSYVVGKGYKYKAVRRRAPVTPGEVDPLARQVQEVIDDFVARTCWGEREQEVMRRCDRDGEAILRLFHGTSGRCDVRFVEPELLRDATGRAHRSFGVVTDPRDVETVHAYSIVEDPQSPAPRDVPADEVWHAKLNTDSTAKRGLPTLYPVRKNLERAEKLLRNMSTLAQVQASFAVIRKHKQFSASAISAFRQAQADVQVSHPLRPGTTAHLQGVPPGSIIDTAENTDWEFPGASIDASSLVAILQAELRAVAARLVMPEYMLTVDASNANYASTLVAEAPSTKNFERLQAFLARRFGDGGYTANLRFDGVLWRVIAYAVESGRLPREALTDVELQVEAPSLTARNKIQETSRAERLHQAGVLSLETWSQWEGLDRQQEERHLATEAPLRDHLGALTGRAAGEGRLAEGCVPNKTGPGHHDERTGHPCSPSVRGGFTGMTLHPDTGEPTYYVSGRPTSQGAFLARGGPGATAKAQSLHPGAAVGTRVSVAPVDRRVFSGEPVPTKTTLTRNETGRVGEAVVLAWLRHQGHHDAGPMNREKPNFPIDVIEDHRPTEVKAGLVSNSKGAQQWRLTFSQESEAEIALYAKMTPEEREEWNADKQRRIHERKQAVIDQLNSASGGEQVKPRTMTVIINPDTQAADIYSFDGFHDRIGWNSEQARKGYVATVRYSHLEDEP